MTSKGSGYPRIVIVATIALLAKPIDISNNQYQQASPFGDVVGILGVAALTAGAVGVGIYRIATATTDVPSISLPKEKDIIGPPPQPTFIYRYGGTNPSNLTPKEKDLKSGKGLSFSTVPRSGCAITTIEEINLTGVVYAVSDGATHVSVYPVYGTMLDWVNAGADSIWTKAIKSVVVKWDGKS